MHEKAYVYMYIFIYTRSHSLIRRLLYLLQNSLYCMCLQKPILYSKDAGDFSGGCWWESHKLVSLLYISWAGDIQQTVSRARLVEDSHRIAWGQIGQQSHLAGSKHLAVSRFKERRPPPVRLLLLSRVFTQNSRSCWCRQTEMSTPSNHST